MKRKTIILFAFILVLFCENVLSQNKYLTGIHPSSTNGYEYAKDLGLNFNRDGTYIIWNWVDVTKDRSLSFKAATLPAHPDHPNSGGIFNYDTERERLVNVDGIAIMNNICPCRGQSGSEQNLTDTAAYRYFVEKTVERYDGDSDLGCTETNGIDCYNVGDNDYPSDELITLLENNPIKVWQTCNQVTDVCEGGLECFENELYAEQFTEVQRITYEAVKKSCPDCLVALAGDSHKELYPAVFRKLNGKYIDVIDFHRFGKVDNYDPKSDFEFLKKALEEANYDLTELKFWITETGTYAGDPVPKTEIEVGSGSDLPYQSEKQQAIGLVKTYISAYAYGVENVLWAWGIVEPFKRNGSLFDYTGLIYDGFEWNGTSAESGIYTDNPAEIRNDRGANIYKLAYFSYKQMNLKINDATSYEVINESDGIFVYKVNKNDGVLYIAWSESETDYEFSGLNSNEIKTTKSIPNVEYGEYVTDFNSVFDTNTQTVNNGKTIIQLDTVPIYLELVNTTSVINKYVNSSKIILYPNPTNGIVNFKNNDISKIEIFDIIGNRLGIFEINESQTHINLNEYKNGIYLLKLFSNEFSIYKKLIINN